MYSSQAEREAREWNRAWKEMSFVEKYNPVSIGIEFAFKKQLKNSED